MATISVDEIAAREEAECLFRMKQETERQAAREREMAKQRQLAELAAREREMRLQREADEIEARRRAEEAIIAAKARAEKEAYDAAVAAHLAALEARSPEEKMMAELEALRNQLEAKLSFLDTGYTTLSQKHVTFEQSCPWRSELNEIKGLIAGLDKKFTQEITSLREMVTKPPHKVRFKADPAFMGLPAASHGGEARNMCISYRMSPQSSPHTGATNEMTRPENYMFSLDVPAGHMMTLVRAQWRMTQANGSVHTHDVTDYVRVYFDA